MEKTPTLLERIDALRVEIAKHNHLYYIKNAPIITDQQYDEMYKELTLLEQDNPGYLSYGSPTKQVGDWVSGENDVVHRHKMYSLQNSYGKEELLKWLKKFPPGTIFYYDMKHDGVAVELFYDHGTLMDASKRGNGYIGPRILNHVELIRGVPTSFIYPDEHKIKDQHIFGPIAIYGEVTITRKHLEKINADLISQGIKPFANPRSAVVGLLGTKRPMEEYLRLLDFTPYGSEDIKKICKTFSQLMGWFTKLGFSIHEHDCGTDTNDDPKKILEAYEMCSRRYYNTTDNHPIDGLVLKVNDLKKWAGYGYTEKVPKFARACKFPEEVAVATITGIVHNLSRYGILTPVATITPVELGGVTIRSVNLFNRERIHLNSAYIGSIVGIYRAGAVIPAIRYALSTEGSIPYISPAQCPSCQAPTIELGKWTRCTNGKCVGTIISRMEFILSRELLNVVGLSTASASALVIQHNIDSLAKLLSISEETLSLVVGKKNATSVYDKIVAIKLNLCVKTSSIRPKLLKKLIFGLCIPGLTESNIDRIFAHGNPSIESVWLSLPSVLIDGIVLEEKGIAASFTLDIVDNATQRLDEIYALIELPDII